MPFITQDKRDHIDPHVDIMWDQIKTEFAAKDWLLDQAGNLAYIVYRLMLLAVDTAGERGWGTLTRVWSDVAMAATYFRKYEIDAYETKKLYENGPVTLQYDDEIPF